MVEPTRAKHGETIAISGKGFPANETLTITLEASRSVVTLGEVKAGPEGDFSARFNLPEEASPGAYQLKVRSEDEVVTVDFAVLEEADGSQAPSQGTSLVFERGVAETTAIILIALALVIAGAALVLAGTEGGRGIWWRR
jgi:hypothetical protein